MFDVVSGRRKRRSVSPATFALSVGAHLLLLGGVAYAAGGEPPVREVATITELTPFPDDPPPPPPVEEIAAPTPPAPAEDTRIPVPGDRVDLAAPSEVPDEIVPEAPGVVPVDPRDFGDGRSGDYVGRPVPGLELPTGSPTPPVPAEYVVPEHLVERRPELDRSGLARALERYYPTVLRNSRVQGRVLIELVVDEEGRVRPESVRVVEASHAAFGEAALRAVERFRFTPAMLGGQPVPVRVTIPIAWSVPR